MEVYERYRADFKKTEFLVGRVLTKSLLSQHLKISPEHISFFKNRYGKLYLEEHLSHKAGNIQFNISHSHNMVTCAVTLGNEIGVDVEKVSRSIYSIAERFFTTGEREYIAKFNLKEREKIVYKIWTMKEAFIKAKGLGLTIALDSFDVTLLEKKFFLKCIELKEE